MSAEINGLRNLFSSDATLHGIQMPPEDATPEQHDAWWVRTHCWHAEIRQVDDEP